MPNRKKTINIRLKEYDRCAGGCVECVHNEVFVVQWLGRTEASVRNFLASGDYSAGDDDRTVEVFLVAGDDIEVYHATYSAPRIRRFRERTA